MDYKYYQNLVSNSEYQGKIRVSRWKKSTPQDVVVVGVEGGTKGDIEQVHKVYKEITALTGLEFKVSGGVGVCDIQIYITNSVYYRDYVDSSISDHMRARGFFTYRINRGTNNIYSASIFVNDELRGITRMDVIREECTQVLGIPNDNNVKGSIFYKKKARGRGDMYYTDSYSLRDKQTIKFLYNGEGAVVTTTGEGTVVATPGEGGEVVINNLRLDVLVLDIALGVLYIVVLVILVNGNYI